MAEPFLSALAEGEELPRRSGRFIIRASGRQTGGGYTLVETSGLRIGEGPVLHAHSREDESFVVLGGRYRFPVGAQHVDASTGALVFAPRGLAHRFEALSEDCRLLHLFIPGGLDAYFRRQRTDMSTDELHALGAEFGISFID